jgi:flagellar export protein FliJ
MAFLFTFEAVLRYRRSLEDQEQLVLRTTLLRRSTVLQQQERLRKERAELRESLQRTLSQAVLPAADLQLCVLRGQSMQLAEEQLVLTLRQLQSEIEAQRVRYQAERQRREALESLRDAQMRNYEVLRKRREQSILDELYLLRRHREL